MKAPPEAGIETFWRFARRRLRGQEPPAVIIQWAVHRLEDSGEDGLTGDPAFLQLAAEDPSDPGAEEAANRLVRELLLRFGGPAFAGFAGVFRRWLESGAPGGGFAINDPSGPPELSGPEAAEALARDARHPEPAVRLAVLEALSRIGDESARVRIMAELLESETDSDVLWKAADLIDLGEVPAAPLKELLFALCGRITGSVSGTLRLLTRTLFPEAWIDWIEARARTRIPALRDALKSRDSEVRNRAFLEVEVELGPAAAPLIPDLKKRLTNRIDRWPASSALAAAGGADAAMFQVIAEILRTGSPNEAETAARVLAALEAPPALAVPAATARLEAIETAGGDWIVVQDAIHLIASSGKAPEPVAELAVRALPGLPRREKYVFVRDGLIRILASAGTEQAIAALEEVCRDPKAGEDLPTAADALIRLGRVPPAECRPRLLRMIEERWGDSGLYAAAAAFGPASREVLPRLRADLEVYDKKISEARRATQSEERAALVLARERLEGWIKEIEG